MPLDTTRTTLARAPHPGAALAFEVPPAGEPDPAVAAPRPGLCGQRDGGQSGPVPDSVLLVTHVPLRRISGRLCLDDQTCAGLERWGESFSQVTFTGIDAGEGPPDPADAQATAVWRPVADLACADRLSVIALPEAYRLLPFALRYRGTRRRLAEAVRTRRYLCFTLGSLTGDWGGIAALESIRQGRAYAVWFDRVEHEVIRRTSSGAPLRRRLKNALALPLTDGYHHRLIARSALGLFQGRDTFGAYAPHARRPFCVYDTHTTQADRIPEDALAGKERALLGGAPLNLVYVGRASAMKGPFDWLETLRLARQAGLRFTATWWGDGPLLGAMRSRAAELGLADCVALPGFEGDRDRLLSAMRAAHLFLFCHLTPESPRCLIEALVCGAPLLGYASPYSEDLVARDGGGHLSPMDDPAALAARLTALDGDRAGLAGMVRAAARTGARFDEETVYRERADLLRRYL
ncbi:glycosyltransferase [Methylorubrum populi]|uniref:Glycosyl transferase family 1 domain-containing protein n=1 Tax=Methylorubrum populi TaxID=223967 RepID=A0A833J8A8_9HYPH|nr:glycosyltransferase [Methylorubrum populi]KAB7785402.1 hypothetical protein F8B43_1903 [Methylorubrum populi]